MNFYIIENNLDRIKFYDSIGIERIFLDLELIGKIERQGHLNTVISKHHSINDIKPIKSILNNSKLIVRTNPIYNESENEINKIIADGADMVMLPFFKTKLEVQKFVKFVDNRVPVILLLETPQALVRLDEVLSVNGISEVHIGLNDLHLGMNLKFMFELISGGIVDFISSKIRDRGIPFGIGGIAKLDEGLIPGADVLAEHVRLGSQSVILSRTFVESFTGKDQEFEIEIKKIRNKEIELKNLDSKQLDELHTSFKNKINSIIND